MYSLVFWLCVLKEWDEAARLNWLQSELNSKRPLFRIRDIEKNLLGLDPDVRKTLMVSYLLSYLLIYCICCGHNSNLFRFILSL